MEVALRLGCTVAELGERMSAEELGLWIAYLQHQPYGSPSLEQAMCVLQAAIYNGDRQRKDKRAWQPADFFSADVWAPPKPMPKDGPSMDDIQALFGRRPT